MDEIERKIVEEGVKTIFDFVKQILTPSVKEVGELLADKVKFWRYQNQVKMLVKAKEYAEENNSELHNIPTKNLVKILEFSSLEEDSIMQEKWARLLANAVTTETDFNTNHIYVELLSQLSATEVLVLDNLWNVFKESGFIQMGNNYNFNVKFLPKYKITSSLGLTTDKADVAYGNLQRLNLVKYGFLTATHGQSQYVDESKVAFTKLGEGFVLACQKADSFDS